MISEAANALSQLDDLINLLELDEGAMMVPLELAYQLRDELQAAFADNPNKYPLEDQ